MLGSGCGVLGFGFWCAVLFVERVSLCNSLCFICLDGRDAGLASSPRAWDTRPSIYIGTSGGRIFHRGAIFLKIFL